MRTEQLNFGAFFTLRKLSISTILVVSHFGVERRGFVVVVPFPDRRLHYTSQ